MIITLNKNLDLDINEFLSERDLNLLKSKYKGNLIAFYVFIDNLKFSGQYIDGTYFEYSISNQTIDHITKKIKIGTPVYASHRKINQSEDERKDLVGEVVYKTTAFYKNFYVGIVGIIITNLDLFRSKNFDAISLEAINSKVDFTKNEIIDFDIKAFALAESDKNPPHGTLAYKIDEMQLYKNNITKEQKGGANMSEITFEDVKEYIRKKGLKPSDLFDSYSIIGHIEIENGKISFEGGDSRIIDILNKKLKKHNLVDEESYKTLRERSEKYLEIEPEYKKYKEQYLQMRKVELLNDYLQKNNIDDKLKAFINKNIDSLNINDENEIGTSIQNFIKTQEEKFKEIIKIFNPEQNNEKEPDDERKKDKEYL